jgi:asparagine synthase (glutamine-hydrolysing)
MVGRRFGNEGWNAGACGRLYSLTQLSAIDPMCGIAGIYNRTNNGVDKTRIVSMGRTLDHRGPDNFSVFAADSIALAHNRLSILDLTPSGNQPFTNDRYALVYNGEIYNYLELKQQLKKRNVSFSSTSDTEVLFHYLIEFGIDRTLAEIKGMYAFAFFDTMTRRLVLARDRLGIKPLYWHEKDSQFYFSSEIKAIAAATCLNLDPVRALFSLAGGGEENLESTLFRGVKPVKPGTYLTLDATGSPRESTYYSLSDQFDRQYFERLGRMSREEIDDLFNDLLNRSVARMLMSDAPIGVFVSGGIDSSLVAAIAARDKDLDLFTADVVGEDSELRDAQALAKTLNADLHVYCYESQTFLRDLPLATYHNECPVVSFVNAVPFFNVAKLAREKSVKAVLTGEGADELFHGYPHMLARRFDSLLRLPLNVVKAFYATVPRLANYLKLDGELTRNDFLGLLVRNFQMDAERGAFFSKTGFLNNTELNQCFTTIGMFNTHLLGLLHRNDRMGMLASIESRFPFLDEDIVRFGINLPLKFKYRKTWRLHNTKHPFIVDKAPVRDVATKLLPCELVQKRKWGFGVKALELLRVRPGFFSDGFVGEICGLTRKGEAHLLEQMPRYYLGKLVSVEVFGRLFGGYAGISEVSESLSAHVSMDEVPRSDLASRRCDAQSVSARQPLTVPGTPALGPTC